ncbi:hypothetical protein FOLKNPGA_01337 [Legionella sp. PC1000]|uniref:hypothetical protein n=1 Tax=Legionella sp. PC1000 TaxID=2746060 RepID=UPI0015F9C7EE|nr:hypothetical protein [Legionella sp. PC1000]QLZ68558.1 hypothetical protein FOLKNPGA_01337 [Legionella sp. PC1000]
MPSSNYSDELSTLRKNISTLNEIYDENQIKELFLEAVRLGSIELAHQLINHDKKNRFLKFERDPFSKGDSIQEMLLKVEKLEELDSKIQRLNINSDEMELKQLMTEAVELGSLERLKAIHKIKPEIRLAEIEVEKQGKKLNLLFCTGTNPSPELISFLIENNVPISVHADATQKKPSYFIDSLINNNRKASWEARREAIKQALIQCPQILYSDFGFANPSLIAEASMRQDSDFIKFLLTQNYPVNRDDLTYILRNFEDISLYESAVQKFLSQDNKIEILSVSFNSLEDYMRLPLGNSFSLNIFQHLYEKSKPLITNLPGLMQLAINQGNEKALDFLIQENKGVIPEDIKVSLFEKHNVRYILQHNLTEEYKKFIKNQDIDSVLMKMFMISGLEDTLKLVEILKSSSEFSKENSKLEKFKDDVIKCGNLFFRNISSTANSTSARHARHDSDRAKSQFKFGMLLSETIDSARGKPSEFQQDYTQVMDFFASERASVARAGGAGREAAHFEIVRTKKSIEADYDPDVMAQQGRAPVTSLMGNGDYELAKPIMNAVFKAINDGSATGVKKLTDTSYQLTYEANGKTYGLTTVSFGGIQHQTLRNANSFHQCLWIHTNLVALGELEGQMAKLHQELFNMHIDKNDPESISKYYDKLAEAYWLGSNLMRTARGNASNMTSWLEFMNRHHSMPSLYTKMDVPMLDNVAISMPLTQFKRDFRAFFEMDSKLYLAAKQEFDERINELTAYYKKTFNTEDEFDTKKMVFDLQMKASQAPEKERKSIEETLKKLNFYDDNFAKKIDFIKDIKAFVDGIPYHANQEKNRALNTIKTGLKNIKNSSDIDEIIEKVHAYIAKGELARQHVFFNKANKAGVLAVALLNKYDFYDRGKVVSKLTSESQKKLFLEVSEPSKLVTIQKKFDKEQESKHSKFILFKGVLSSISTDKEDSKEDKQNTP